MTDRTEDLLRRTLARAADDMAGPAAPPPDLRPRLRRRRLAKAATTVMVLLVPVALGVSALDRSPGQESRVAVGKDAVVPTTTSSTLLAEVPMAGPPLAGVEVVYGHSVMDLSRSPAIPSAGLSGTSQSWPAPVRTPSGLLVALGEEVDRATIVLVTPAGAELVLARGAAGMAVGRGGERVAWAVSAPSGRAAEVVEATLDGRVLHRVRLDRFARVVGYAGDVVVLETGDGGEAAAATWVPGSATVRRLVDVPEVGFYGGVVATDPLTGVAVFDPGDGGGCGTLADVRPDGTVGLGRATGTCLPRSGAGRFDPSGATVALPAGGQGAGRVEIVGSDGAAVRTFTPHGDPVQVRWLDDDTLIILSRDAAFRLDRCVVSTGSCDQRWTFADDAVVLVLG